MRIWKRTIPVSPLDLEGKGIAHPSLLPGMLESNLQRIRLSIQHPPLEAKVSSLTWHGVAFGAKLE